MSRRELNSPLFSQARLRISAKRTTVLRADSGTALTKLQGTREGKGLLAWLHVTGAGKLAVCGCQTVAAGSRREERGKGPNAQGTARDEGEAVSQREANNARGGQHGPRRHVHHRRLSRRGGEGVRAARVSASGRGHAGSVPWLPWHWRSRAPWASAA